MNRPGAIRKETIYARRGKRLFDLALALPAVAAAAPLMVLLAVLVRAKLGRPVLFRQTRPGLQGQPFNLLKFRTMTDRQDCEGNLLPDAERLTAFGRWMRRWSLDELPELFNVLKGDMSLVGPRPLLMKYLPYYTEQERLRHSVKPGITGWAQIHGRNEASWDERLENDVWYVENRNFSLDMRIIGSTIAAVLGKKGIVVDPRSTMLNLDEERFGITKGVGSKREGRE